MSDSVEFRHLEYLVAIEEKKNFTKAAEKMYRSQPAVSQQIRGLEADLGFTVFDRHGRGGVTPTPAGELVLGWARTILSERREIFAIARAIHKGEVPPLRMGFLIVRKSEPSNSVSPSVFRAVSQARSCSLKD